MKLRIAYVQFDIAWEDVSQNIVRLQKILEGHTLDDVDLLVLPETWPTGFSMQPDAHRAEHTALEFMREMSTEKNITVMGGVPTKTEVGQENRCVWVQANEIDYYTKNRAFKFAREHHYYQPGALAKTWTLNHARISPLICYDLRFPELARRVACQTDVLVYIANWPKVREHHWRSLLVARAIENQCFVVAVNRIGHDGNQLEYPGASMVIDPLGTILVDSKENEGLFKATLDIAMVEQVRKKWPFLADM